MPVAASQSPLDDDGVNTLRVLIATDNHLGFEEKDSVRQHDSFLAFEEILKTARDRDVDMMVLGGDLFHENKPSRATVVRCMRLLREYALRADGAGGREKEEEEEEEGGNGVRTEVLNDRAMEDAVGASLPRINFQSRGSNVRLPIFAIHGNHDDPTGAEHLSVMDVLAEANLLTYFGKHDVEAEGIGKVQVSPVVLRKGSARLALYGLGHIRDERLNRMFDAPGHVRFVKPEGVTSSVRDSSEVFNLFMIHQNKQRAVQAKNYVSPAHLPLFLDLVCWGHEHECLITPRPAIEASRQRGEKGFLVSQPGSSVVTSLIEGEAGRKKVMLLSVRESEYHVEEITLRSTRPFVFKAIKLSKTPGLDPDDMELVEEFLHDSVEELIEAAARQEVPTDVLRLPLVRIRVDYTGGFSTINTQRFGQKYVGRVANPSDVVAFHKEMRRFGMPGDGGAASVGAAGTSDEGFTLRPDAQMDHAEIDRLIRRHLRARTKILPVSDLSVAVSDYVEKQEKNAIEQCVKRTIEETAKVFEKKQRRRKRRRDATRAPAAEGDLDGDDAGAAIHATDDNDDGDDDYDGGGDDGDDDEVLDDDAIERMVSEYVKTKDGEAARAGTSGAAWGDGGGGGGGGGGDDDMVPDSQTRGDGEEGQQERDQLEGRNSRQSRHREELGRHNAHGDGKENVVAPRRRKAAATVRSRQPPPARSRRGAVDSGDSDDDNDEFVVDDESFDSEEEMSPVKKKPRAAARSSGRGRSGGGAAASRPVRARSRPTKPSVIENLISSDED